MNVIERLGSLPTGPEGVRYTLDAMIRLVKAYREHPSIRRVAEQLIANVEPHDFSGEAEAVHRWVRDNIHYTSDATDTDSIRPPLLLLDEPNGDCEDMALLTATLLESIGHKVRFVAVAFDQDAFSHVMVETRIGNDWVASDTTEAVDFGWSAPGVTARMVRHV